jgi:predicted MFS family arabinose efflux permease
MAGKDSRDSDVRSVAEIVLHAPRSARVLVFGVFINRATAFFSTFLVLFLDEVGFSVGEMPIILLLVGIATPAGSLLAGWASDRFRREDVLLASTVMASAALGTVALSHDRTVLIGAVVAAALLTQSYLPPAQTLLFEQTEEEERVPIAAFFRLALNAGVAVGAVLALIVGAAGQIRWLFAIDCVGYLLFAFILWAGFNGARRRTANVDEPAEAEVDRWTQAEAEPVAAESVAGRPSLGSAIALFLGIGVNAAVYVQYSSTVALAVAGAHGAAAYAALLILNGGLVILGELPLTSFTRRLQWQWPLVAGTACMAIGIAISGAFQPYEIVVLGWITWTLGEMLFSPVVMSAVSVLAPPSRRGRYQGYLAFVQAVGFAIGPPLGVLLYGHSPGALWAACVGLGLLACVAIGITDGAGRRRAV